MSLWRQTREQPELLAEAPELPPLAAHVWMWFCELANERENNGMGVSRITSRNMLDWCWASGNTLELWERRAIRAIDNAFMKDQS